MSAECSRDADVAQQLKCDTAFIQRQNYASSEKAVLN